MFVWSRDGLAWNGLARRMGMALVAAILLRLAEYSIRFMHDDESIA